MKRIVPVVLLVMGCRSTDVYKGTVVGNPGDASMRVADGTDVETLSASADVQSMQWTDCTGNEQIISVAEEVDFLSESRVEVPAGTWCELLVSLSSALAIEGVVENGAAEEGAPVSLLLEVGTVNISTEKGLAIDGDALVLEFAYPDWFGLDDLVWSEEGGGGYVVDPEENADFSNIVSYGSALYQDDDRDGQLSEDERQSGAVASGDRGENWDDDDDDDDDRE